MNQNLEKFKATFWGRMQLTVRNIPLSPFVKKKICFEFTYHSTYFKHLKILHDQIKEKL